MGSIWRFCWPCRGGGRRPLNDCLNVYPRRMAVGAVKGVGEIADLSPLPQMNYGAVSVNWRFGPPAVMEPADLTPLKSLDPAKVDFINVDAEGLGPQVLRGASRALVIEAGPQTFPEIFTLLAGGGYEACWHCRQIFDPQNARASLETVWFNPGDAFLSADIFAVPRDAGWIIKGLSPVAAEVEWEQLPQSADNFRASVIVQRP